MYAFKSVRYSLNISNGLSIKCLIALILLFPSIFDKYIFFDDLLENLEGAKEHGWIPIWISPNYKEAYKYSFVYRAFPSLTEALKHI